ncbi:MAG: sulfotransferase [Verrucomicrobiae bacterium]|nr:sulfotransferase [Verrucomicrobiae bacterium]
MPAKKGPSDLRPIFIVGAAKSGTSFLASLFESHPKILALFETRIYSTARRGVLDPRELVRQALGTPGLRVSPYLSPDILDDEAAWRDRGTTDDRRPAKRALDVLISAAFDAMPAARRGSLTHFVEKTPSHCKSVRAIISDFPNAKFLHVVRDPRDNYLSLKRRMNDPDSIFCGDVGYHPAAFIKNRILPSLHAAVEHLREFPAQYRFLLYEDLVAGGEKKMRQLAEWLDLEWDEGLLSPMRDGRAWTGNSFAPDLKSGLEPFDRRPIGRWERELSGRERTIMEGIMDLCGLGEVYPIESRPRSWAVMAALALPFAGEFGKYFRCWREGTPRSAVLREMTVRYVQLRLRIARELERFRRGASVSWASGRSWPSHGSRNGGRA